MKAIARLLYLYLFGAAGLRWLSAAGLISVGVCAFLWRWRPDWLPAILFGWLGLAALFVGTSLMPVMITRMAGGHWGATVPYLRIKLLASALLTVAFVTLPVLVLMYAGVGQTPASSGRHLDPKLLAAAQSANVKLMWIACFGAANLFTWLYVVAWLVTSRKTVWGLFRALLVLSVILYAPVREVTTLDASLRLDLVQLLATWTVFAVLFLQWPRSRRLASRVLERLRAARSGLALDTGGPSSTLRARAWLRPRIHATDILLGTAHPWLMAAALALPALLAARLSSYVPGAWLYCLVLFASVSAAIAGQAANRSRALWLRGGWSRAGLFLEVERAFWRHNLIVLAVLLAVMIAVGIYAGLAARLTALGVPLLVLGTALGTYLGLMVTRGMRWQETSLAIGVMLLLMAGALLADRAHLGKPWDVTRLSGLATALALAAIGLRGVAKRRWTHIDWSACRAERVSPARAAA